ncbi:hypothetical protein [Agrobacterium vaccinii]|uniref:hypothetical protein n=1 Tax=Agrobacterium vaccinii TaxID=2735528 RepID=UPI001E3A8B1D|nr:hypothetical protein [Agrobacterium vaccinii]UHS59558.1 hypothetical protein HRS00_22380 [Agrobacterium vaccinii]
MGSSSAPDAGVPDTFLQDKSCGQLADDKLTEAKARIIFLGLLAGIGDEREIQAARNSLKEAVMEVQGLGLDDAEQRKRVLELQKEWYNLKYSSLPRGMSAAQRDQKVKDIDAEISGMPVVSKWTPAGVADQLEQWLKSWIEDFKKYYNEVKALIEADRWGAAVCKVGLDITFIVAEEVLVWGSTALVGAAGGAAAAVSVHISARVVARGSKLASVIVRARKSHAVSLPHKAGHDVNFGQIDTAKPKDLTISKIDDEVGMGGAGRDHEPSTKGKEIIDARLKKRNEVYDRIAGGLSPKDLDLAAKEGYSPAQVSARQKLYDAFAKEYGDKTSINKGMDWNKPMRIVKTPPPSKLAMWRNENDMDRHGNYYDPNAGASTPDQSGINSVGRHMGIFRNEKPGLAFEGVGAPIPDTWSVYGVNGSRNTQGGTRQFYVPDEFKPEPADRIGNLHNWRDLPGNKPWVKAEKDKSLRYEFDPTKGYPVWYYDGPPIKEIGGER